MTCYFGDSLADKILQCDIENEMSDIIIDTKDFLKVAKNQYLDKINSTEAEKRKFWNAVFHMITDEVEYWINEIEDNV